MPGQISRKGKTVCKWRRVKIKCGESITPYTKSQIMSFYYHMNTYMYRDMNLLNAMCDQTNGRVLKS